MKELIAAHHALGIESAAHDVTLCVRDFPFGFDFTVATCIDSIYCYIYIYIYVLLLFRRPVLRTPLSLAMQFFNATTYDLDDFLSFVVGNIVFPSVTIPPGRISFVLNDIPCNSNQTNAQKCCRAYDDEAPPGVVASVHSIATAITIFFIVFIICNIDIDGDVGRARADGARRALRYVRCTSGTLFNANSCLTIYLSLIVVFFISHSLCLVAFRSFVSVHDVRGAAVAIRLSQCRRLGRLDEPCNY